jgi:hypothetical protein
MKRVARLSGFPMFMRVVLADGAEVTCLPHEVRAVLAGRVGLYREAHWARYAWTFEAETEWRRAA